MKEGFTTGSCAAAAALAGCLWQRDGVCPTQVELRVPEGRCFHPEILPLSNFWCAVYKQAGDDPDVTDGCQVRVLVTPEEQNGPIRFLAGEGVGIITLPGLKLPPGEAAVNPVPRKMIEEAVRSVFGARGAQVTISIPGGEALARKTFNPRLGIRGGLSVLGTSGIVRPMSEEALTASIALELSVLRASGAKHTALVFGNQGEKAARRLFPDLPAAQMSNYVGFALETCAQLGFQRALLLGHPGKLLKVAAGVWQTHSRWADARREALIAQLALMDAPCALCCQIMSCVTTEAAASLIDAAGYGEVWNRAADAAQRYAEEKVLHQLTVDALFVNADGMILGQSNRLRQTGRKSESDAPSPTPEGRPKR